MKALLARFWVAGLAIAGVLTLLLVLTETKAIAQIKAALVKNVDEPGRTPWVTRSQILPGSGCYEVSDCSNYDEFTGLAAVFSLRQVPAGKRWIVQSASGGFTNGNGRTITIELGTPRATALVFDGVKWMYGGPFYLGASFDSALFTAAPQVIFGPGETPTVRVSAKPGLGGYFVLNFSGYLIDAAN